MRVRHTDGRLQRLEIDPSYSCGFGRPVVRGFRKVMGWIRDAEDERDLYAMRSLHFEKLKGARSHQRSMRLDNQFPLILELEEPERGKTIVVISIEDYH
jgi:proteic killer suppression protein